jgi:hypothetical protein
MSLNHNDSDDGILEGSIVPNMDSTPLVNVPDHLSEARFRIYEPYIFRAVDRWPDETEFPPPFYTGKSGAYVSAVTFCARMADALQSIRTFRWETKIDVEKLLSMTKDYRIAHDDGPSVWFRRKVAPHRPMRSTAHARAMGYIAPASSAQYEQPPLWRDWSESTVIALCLLKGEKREGIPLEVRLQGLVPQDFINDLQTRFPNTAVFHHEGFTVVI